MNTLPKVALGAWAWGNGGTFGGNLTADTLRPIIGVTKVSHVEDAAKAAGISLNADETAELEHIADSLELNVIRFWEKEMK